jgi:hypothetical protein
MKRLIVAALLAASCTPATTGVITPASGTPQSPGASQAPTSPASPAASATPVPATTPASLDWPRLADLPVSTPIAKARLWARSTKDVYAVVGTGDLWHYDGTGWTATAVPGAGNLIAVTGTADAVWASTDTGAIAKRPKSGAVTVQAISTAAIPSLAVVDAATETLLAACTDGSNAALVVRGTTVLPQVPVKKRGTAVATGNGKQLVFADGGFAAYRESENSAWIHKDNAANDPIRAAVAYPGGRSAMDVMGVGDKGASTRYDGSTYRPFGTTTNQTALNDVGAVSGDGLFAVGNDGLVLFFGAEAWRPIVNDPSLGNVLAMAALGNREIIILTSKGQLFSGPYIQYI